MGLDCPAVPLAAGIADPHNVVDGRAESDGLAPAHRAMPHGIVAVQIGVGRHWQPDRAVLAHAEKFAPVAALYRRIVRWASWQQLWP